MMDPQALGTAMAALAAVLLLILLVARALRRFGLAPGAAPRGPRRLALVEALPIDGRRRLLLLRCDGQDVLCLVGGPQDLVLKLPDAKP
ncbi:flagellar biosynthetic protein FliO [Falsiroseomonas selenitidurans]|uniref:Flagellar biosynthesis protein FliO n=1 Tax=Falsiroseomonas selenitidurans TaxID=2716335 RepID=A0ABX1E3W6_9PROT|nr:flagellar biosynthetic protein FliO [Falsiroseomonas selenitidurans]NKC31698.1 hypothetical protein [Falsiroseomonas selenitidurans]